MSQTGEERPGEEKKELTARTLRKRDRSGALARVACVLGLTGVIFSLIHFAWPTPLAFASFMIFGQGAFFLAMLCYGTAVLLDLRSRKVL